MIILFLSMMGCSEFQSTKNTTSETNSPCEEPPSSLTWGQQTYILKTVGNQDLEPGMKLGYLNCNNGVYSQQGEGENATFNIYSFGSPKDSDDLLYFGTWGRALYTSADVNSKSQVNLDESVQIEEAQLPELKPEVKKGFSLDPKLENELQEKKQPVQGLFETTMETVKSDGQLNIHFSTKNISGKDLQINHSSGQKYDIWVLNDQDEEVYRWSYNKAFTQALIERGLSKSGQLDFDESWNLQDNDGKPIPAGQYTIMVKVMIGLESGTISQDELMAKYTVVLDSSPISRLQSVEVSFYKSNSSRGQPELINMYTDKSAPEKLKEFSTWTENSKSLVDVDATNVNSIYFIQLDFDNKTSKYFLCLYASDKKVYLKQIPFDEVKDVNLDQFDSSQVGHLIELVGKAGWMESKAIPQ
jgi:hypothetical protein